LTADYLTTRLRRIAAQLPYVPRTLALVWTAARGWTTAWVALLVIQGLLPVATVYLTRALVNALVAAIRAGSSWDAFRPTLVLAALMGGILLLAELLHGVSNWLRRAQADLVQDHISALIHEKSVALDLAFYESPDFYDHLYRARDEASHRPVALLETAGSLLENGVALAAMAAVLFSFGPWLPFALVFATLPALYVVVRYAELQHLSWERSTPEQRRSWYYDALLTTGESAAELRLFGLGDYFRAAFTAVRGRLRQERLSLAAAQSRAELFAGLLALAVSAAAMGWMLWRASRGLATLGDLAMFYQTFQSGMRLTRTLLEHTGQLYQNSLFLADLFAFLGLQPKIADRAGATAPPTAAIRQIRFRSVTFQYPGSARPALQGFDLTIAAGSMAAMVGPNGAGKSTLLKLLCRLYDADSGSIEIDGIDLRSMPVADLRRLITVLFQEPVHYNTSAAENIALGDLSSKASAGAIASAARDAGADGIISRLPRGYQTLLGNSFESGAELSVGEWQRVALARAFLRQAPIMILDEPTSAMDPWAESDWMTRFRQLAAGRIAILITHRFTTARFADVIHVVENGKVVESGNHEELLALGGLYAQGWSAGQDLSLPG
jgi:ATP-binding cassette, subfamily B, bacterial